MSTSLKFLRISEGSPFVTQQVKEEQMSDMQFDVLHKHELLQFHSEDEYDDSEVWGLNLETLGHPEKEPASLAELLSIASRLEAHSFLLDKPLADLNEKEALDLLNYCLSAPEWSVSFLEDICEIVRATGRTEVLGAQWAAH